MRFVLVLLLLLGASPVLAQPALSFRDNFTSYAAGSDGAPVWDTDDVGWSVRDGKMLADTGTRSFAICKSAAKGREQTIQATLSIQAARAKDWKVAGIVLYDDVGNYWHLALVESPAPEKRHQVELQESYHGAWLATSAASTRLTALPGNSFSWEYDHPYRLRLELAQDRITGSVTELDGTPRAGFGYKLDNKAVMEGRAGLDCGGFQAAFSDFQVDVTHALPEPTRPAPTFPAFTASGFSRVRARATGFFRVEKMNGKWWLISPRGEAFFAVGTDHVNYNASFCEKLGYSPYQRKCEKKYGGSEETWASVEAKRLKEWGFNALGVGWSPGLKGKGLSRCEFIAFGSTFSATDDIAPQENWTGFPNVFSPRWPAFCDHLARRVCVPVKNAPWVIGYFLDNELEWFGKNHKPWGLLDECMKKPAGHSAKQAMLSFLQGRYASIQEFNQVWGARFGDWKALGDNTQVLEPASPRATADRLAFIRLIEDRYFSITHAAIRKWDRRHLDLGCRFAGFAPPGALEAAGRYCDVVSVNYYGNVDLERGISTDMPKVFASYFQECRRPMMITEWSFPAYDSGLPNLHGAGQRVTSQKDRARCYQVYQTALMSFPFMVGSNYFMWADEPALGISSTFPEDSNYGLVDVNDRAWPELTTVASRLNPRVYPIHAGLTPEISVAIAADGRSLALRNSGGAPARFKVDLWMDGRKRVLESQLGSHARASYPLPAVKGPGGHLIAAAADLGEDLPETNRSDNTAVRMVYRSGLPWSKGDMRRLPLILSNPTSASLEQAYFAELVPALGPEFARGLVYPKRLVDAGSGRELAFQVDGAGGNAELCFDAGAIPPYSCRTFLLYLQRRGAASVKTGAASVKPEALSFRFDTGKLVLEHKSGTGDLLSSVAAGNVPLGHFVALVHQELAQSLWVAADRTEEIKVYHGPVRFAADITVAAARGGSETRTAAGQDGSYAAQQARPHRFRACYRISAYPGQPWFSSRLLWIENSDWEPWRLASYYHYALSAIGGSAEDDMPARAISSKVAAWEDPKAGAYYGFIQEGEEFKMNYWKDPGPGGSEHPDVWREVDLLLSPGERYAASQPPALFFGYHGPVEGVRRIVSQARFWNQVEWKAFGTEGSMKAMGQMVKGLTISHYCVGPTKVIDSSSAMVATPRSGTSEPTSAASAAVRFRGGRLGSSFSRLMNCLSRARERRLKWSSK